MIDNIDIDVLQDLFDSFAEATGTATAILDLEGNVLVASGWQDICVRFHRTNPETACRCQESDTCLAGRLTAGQQYNVYQCRNGLVDVAVPIMVEDRHVANLFAGQFLFSPPDIAYFKQQAAQFGFDEAAYLDALSRVPVLDRRQVEKTMTFLGKLATAIGEIGGAKLRIDAELAERKTAEKALQASEQQKRLIIETVPDLIWLKDTDGKYLACNKMFERFFGATEAEIIGKTDYDFVDRALADFFRRHDRAAMDAGKSLRNEEWITFADDGHTVLLETSKTPLMDSDGQVLGVLGIGRDITERKGMERRLAHTQKMEVVGQLAGGTAHDFNNLLQVVQANLDLINLRNNDDDKTRQLVESAKEAVRRGAKLSQQLLSFSRQQTLYPEALDPNDLIEGTAGLLARTLGEDIDIETCLDETVGSITVDPGGLENAILNLALNARAAMPGGGRLILQSNARYLKEEMETEEGILSIGDYVEIAVIDSGCGMPPDVLTHAFEPFFTTKAVGEGSGLGLSMVYGFTLQSDGHTVLESEPGKGTMVLMLFPATTTKVGATCPPEGVEAIKAGTESILVVEDDANVRHSIVMVLQELGYTTRAADSASAALAILEQEAGFDLLFTDVVMPGGMNGVELAQEAVGRHPGIKVLLMSGYPERVLEKAGGPAAPRFPILDKPYTNQDLHEAIRSVLADDEVLQNDAVASSRPEDRRRSGRATA